MSNLFDRPDCPYMHENGECNFDYVPCDQQDKNRCNIHNQLNIANKRSEEPNE